MRFAIVSSIGTLVVVFACAGPEAPTAEDSEAPETEAAQEYPDAVSVDPDHYAVEFENDAVRLVRITYGPGEESTMHRHPANCSIALSPGSWQMTAPDGSVTEDTAAMGEVECGEATVHLPKNTGDAAAELILVELAANAEPGTAWAPEQPDAVTADPDHYTVEFENDVVRLLRIRYGPGETSSMHHHPANCAIFLHDQPATFELPSGEVEEVDPSETGTVLCTDGEVHLPTNAGDSELELVLLELKGREKLGG